MTTIQDIDQLHYLLIYFDEFSELKGKKPVKSWLDDKNDTYNIKYECGFLFSAPKDFIDIICDGAVHDTNPIINSKNPEMMLVS